MTLVIIVFMRNVTGLPRQTKHFHAFQCLSAPSLVTHYLILLPKDKLNNLLYRSLNSLTLKT